MIIIGSLTVNVILGVCIVAIKFMGGERYSDSDILTQIRARFHEYQRELYEALKCLSTPPPRICPATQAHWKPNSLPYETFPLSARLGDPEFKSLFCHKTFRPDTPSQFNLPPKPKCEIGRATYAFQKQTNGTLHSFTLVCPYSMYILSKIETYAQSRKCCTSAAQSSWS